MEFTRKIPGYGYSKNLSCDPAYFSLGVGVCRIAAVENTVCRRDQSRPRCESSCRPVFAVWNREEYQGDITTNSTPPLARFSLASILKKADAPKKCSASISVVFRVGSFETSLLAAKLKDSCPIRPKKIRTKASLRTFTIQTATKLLSGEEKYEPD